MNTKEFKNQLELKLKNLESDLQAIGQFNPVTNDWEAIPDPIELSEADENSGADAIEEWNERRATLSALETDYRNVKRALDKIAAGSFGRCEISGQPIEPERLSANPTARTCIAHMDEEQNLSL